jgi:hypothetical protein
MKRLRTASLVAAGAMVAAAAWADPVVPAKGIVMKSLPVKSGRFSGIIIAPDMNPLSGAKVEILDGEGHVIAATTTGDAGEFAIANLPEGQYTINVADMLKSGITSSPQGEIESVRMLIPAPDSAGPSGPPPPAPPAVPYTAGGGYLGNVNWTTVLVSTGVSVAVGVPVSYGVSKWVEKDQTASP